MKKGRFIILPFAAWFFFGLANLLSAQTNEPWTSKDLMDPGVLAGLLSSPKEQRPVIFNIGPLANIQGAITIGSMTNKANLDKLGKALEKIPKDKMVVIYCGCCPFRNCPNIRPAFSMLKERGYKKPKLLNLKQNLKVDWTDQGYPLD